MLGSKPLYQHMLENILEADCFNAVYVDSDSEEIREYAEANGMGFIQRVPELALETANGNDMLVHHLKVVPGYDLYFQLYVTAPFLSPENIRACVHALKDTADSDSVFTATEEYGWFWRGGQPVNFRPGILPRSQDVAPMIKETTGLYGITVEALDRYRCRIGKKPLVHLVHELEAVDLDTEDDFFFAEYVVKKLAKSNREII